MIKNSIALYLQSKTFAELADHAQQIHNSLVGNLTYPAPPVSVVNQQAAIDNLNAGIKAWGVQGQRGGRLAHSQLIAAREGVRENLKILAHYCMSVTPNDPVSWEAIGFVTKLKRERVGNPAAAKDVRMIVHPKIPAGSLKLRWKKPPDTVRRRTVYYKVMRSADEDFANAETVATLTRTSFIDSPERSGVIYYYRVVSHNAYGEGPVSDMCMAAARVV